MRQIATEFEIEISIKVILAVLIGMSLSEALGWRNSLTITFTMILVTYQNRGFFGVRTYYRLRMQHQVLLCLMMYMLVTPLQMFTNLEDWVILLLTAPPVAAFFLYLFFVWGYTPMNLSPVISPLMLMNTAFRNTEFYYWRILFTFIALLLGWGITMIYPFRSKVSRTEKSLKNISSTLLKEVESIAADGEFVLSDACKKKLPDIVYELTEINTYLAVVSQDIKTPKYAVYQADIPRIKALQAFTATLLQLIQYIAANAQGLNKTGSAFRTSCMSQMRKLASYGRSALEEGCLPESGIYLAGSFEVEQMSLTQLSLLALLVKYRQNAQALADLCSA